MGDPSGALRVSDACAPCSSPQEVTFVNWHVYKVNVAETEPALYLFSAEARCQVIGWGNSQNISDWSPREATLICKMSLHDVKVGVWCATSATKLWGCFYRFVFKYSHIFLAHTKTVWREAFRMECFLCVCLCVRVCVLCVMRVCEPRATISVKFEILCIET